MKFDLASARAMVVGDRQADRVVPPSGFTAQLTIFAAAAMAFLAVFALALSLALGSVFAFRWATKDDQFDDMESPAVRILNDD